MDLSSYLLTGIHSHGSGYAYWELFRLLWHYLHWWSVPVSAAFLLAVGFVKAMFGGDN